MLEGIWQDVSSDEWFQLAFLLFAALISNFIFARLRLPKILGLVLVGVLIGPSILDIISMPTGTEGDASSEAPGSFSIFSLLAEFGAIIILFMIGLEFEIRDIYTKKNVLVALGGIALPWVGGYLIAELMLADPGDPYDKFAQSVFVGTALIATSVAVTAGVLKELGYVNSSVGKVILGAAIIDDVLGMIVLAMSTGIASGEGVDAGSLSILTIEAVLFVTLGAYLGMKLFSRMIDFVEAKGLKLGLVESGFLLALGFAFLYAFISRLIGISPIVGAFIAGASFCQCSYRKPLMQGVAFLEWAFAPMFFVSLGVLVNIWLPLEIWLFALALAAVAILSKVVGAWVPARALGISNLESAAVGFGMAPRLEVAMVIALYGLTNAIITEEVYSVIILTGLVTILIAPTVLRHLIERIKGQTGTETPAT